MRIHLFLLFALAFVAFAFASTEVDMLHMEDEALVNEDVDVDMEVEDEVDMEAEASDSPTRIPALSYMNVKDVKGVVQFPIGAIPAIFGQDADPVDPFDRVKVVASLPESGSGWALKQQGAVPPANITDLFTLSYDAIHAKKAFFNPFLISKNYNIRHYSYVLVPGFGPAEQLFKPVTSTLATFGVHPTQVSKAAVDYTKSTADAAASVYKSIKQLYVDLHEQPVVVFVHGAGIVPFHAAYALYPDLAELIHGVIALNPVYGGSLLLEASAPKDLTNTLSAYVPKGPMVSEFTRANRKAFAQKYPIDYNSLRMMTVSTHDETPFNEFVKSTSYIKNQTTDLSDGFTALADQLIPGSRCIILNAGHFDLVLPQSRKNIDYDQTAALQAIFYSFFKTTP